MKILNSKEAFEAMMAGRKIMCRAVGELMDFDDLDRFPATIFAMPGYEFCIKVETMELAGITFTKPLILDDVVEDQEIFIIHPDHISQVKYSKQCMEYFKAVDNGFAQADKENAELQLVAMGELFGRIIVYPPTIDNTGKPKKSRSTKAKNETEQAGIPAGPGNAVPDIEKQPEPVVIQPIEAIEQEATDNTESPVTETEEDSVETDPVKLVEKFTAQIDQFTKADDVLSFRHVFLANGYLDQKDQQHLCKLTEDKLLELDPEQYTPKVEPESIADEVIEVMQPSLIDEIDQQATKVVKDKICKDMMSGSGQSSYPVDMLYTQKKKMLINRIQEMDSIEALERLAPAIPAAKFNPEDHQELLQIYAERKTAMQHADYNSEVS
ncbi:hypothetical protein DCL20_14375 [Acinetobacter schindleri]|uniref:hypothetical protein n=1 Tax=Acinetobacter schindleri TaxID=108981 RepID=UPI000D38EA2C|nr:hypothetical protein [Acinetobacter schindleri]PUQ99921.1 hypothetical protein DCL20_14375 [Acinetobacter schindleri]